jgi:cbb3-type cytochrome oxidase subunit 1
LAQFHGTVFGFFGSFADFTIFCSISNFFGPSTTEETLLVEMHIWCIKIGIVLALHFNPWVEASAGGL